MTLLPAQSVLDTPKTTRTDSVEAWRGYGTGMVPRWYHRTQVPVVLRSEKVRAFPTLASLKTPLFLPWRLIVDTSDNTDHRSLITAYRLLLPVASQGIAPAREPSELPRGLGVRWLAGNGADTALDGVRRVAAKAVCALTPPPTGLQTAGERARTDARSAAQGELSGSLSDERILLALFRTFLLTAGQRNVIRAEITEEEP
jgi:hypothetical protein